MSSLTDQIKALYYKDQQSNALVDDCDLPLSYETINPEWLTKILCANHPGAKVESLQLGKPDDGSSNRRKISVRYNAEGASAGLPERLFCKASHSLERRLVLGLSGSLAAETTFYKEVRPLLDIESPESYFAEYNPHTFNSLIILQDISNRVESFCTHETKMDKVRIKSQLEELAKLHDRFLEAPELQTLSSKLGNWPQFLKRTEEFGMKEGCNQGFLDAKEVIPVSLYSRYEEIWPKTVASAQRHNELPQTIIHSDAHLKNWFCLPHDRMGVADWHCCTCGHWSRDLAYTIVTACSVEDRRLWEKELITYYLEKMAERGSPNISYDEAWDNYRQQMLGVLAWWTITLSPTDDMADMQPRDTTLEFIRRIAIAMDDLDTMDIE